MELKPPAGDGPSPGEPSPDAPRTLEPVATPDADLTSTATNTFWTVERPDRAWGRPSSIARIIDFALVLAALGALYVVSAVGVAGRALPAAERLGFQIGTILTGVAIGLAVRWFYLRRRASVRPIARLLSPWLLVGLVAATVATVGAYTPLTPADPTSALRISSAYTLVELEPGFAAEIQARYNAKMPRGSGGMTIREVDGDDGSMSFLMVMDGAFAPDTDLSEVARGMADAAGGDPVLDDIGGQPVAIVTTAQQSLVTWIESPFSIMVFAADEVTARDVVAAVLAVPVE